MIRIRDISLPPEHNVHQLRFEAGRLLRVSSLQIRKLLIVRRSVDARKKPNIRIIYTVDVAVEGDEQKLLKKARCKQASLAPTDRYHPPITHCRPEHRPVVVGFGPAGMFAALVLAMSGLKPLVLERGEAAPVRHEKVKAFFETGVLDPRSNVQFGEGGAGTFSDGKLNTGLNNPRISWILEQFVKAGAQEELTYDAKPHVGTDVLLEVVQKLRERILALGGEIQFATQVTRVLTRDGRVTGVETEQGTVIACDRLILAIGHSARDTFRMLQAQGIPLEPKPFAMGVRIEHRQSMVDRAQYGRDRDGLPPADYKLVEHLQDNTVYTFCMCPGGKVVAAASQEGAVVTNGMSDSARDGENANAALLVTVHPREFPYEGALGGMLWQQELEEKAYQVSGSFRAPAQLVGDFLSGRPSTGPGEVEPSYRPGVVWCDLQQVLPGKLTAALQEALPSLDKKLHGFANHDSVLTAPETRSSSPVRILRDDTRQSSIRGLYPTGEGAGYAGGIMSAAIDGILTAEAIIATIGRNCNE